MKKRAYQNGMLRYHAFLARRWSWGSGLWWSFSPAPKARKESVASRCEVQVAYAIGVAKPMGVYVTTFGTGVVPDEDISKVVSNLFDFRPGAIVETLDLLRPVYAPTAAYGHFGRTEKGFTWERTDRAEELRKELMPKRGR